MIVMLDGIINPIMTEEGSSSPRFLPSPTEKQEMETR
jgi:hypothetical protein